MGRDKHLDKLVSDPDWRVRESVAIRGREQDLLKLENDENQAVREEVARQRRMQNDLPK
ncbi:MAG: hypothetical protein MR612_04625 [Lactobacillus delbrueckii]|nr:hypothetical protein [Lactobacillus delbrueckii]